MTDAIRNLLNQYNISYKESSSSFRIKCLSPFHNDSTPSFNIDKRIGVFHCFGCGLKGNYKSLYKLITGNYYKSTEQDIWNINYHIKKKEIKKDDEILIYGKLYDPLKDIDIRNWLRKYGVYEDSFIQDYQITYSKYSEMVASQLKDDPKMYTKMINRICSPIYKNNKIINVEGRDYITTTSTKKNLKILYVRGGSTHYLYNFENIDKTKPVVIVEGIKDFWKVWNVYKNTIVMFRNILSEEQINLLNTIQNDIIFFIDHDEGGHITLVEADKQLEYEFKFCTPPREGEDPNNCTLREIDNCLTHAKYYNESLVDSLFSNENVKW